MTILQSISAALNWQIRVNENFAAVSPAGSFSKKDSTTTGLTLGYYGGILDGVSYADGTHLLTASTTRYVVAARATGVVSSATGTTNWNDSTNYKRMGVAVVGTSTITSWTDWREFGGGGGGGGGATAFTDLTDVPASYTGEAAKLVAVNATEDGLEFITPTAASAAPIVTESGTSLLADDTNAGNYTRFTSASAKTYTFDDSETYATSDEYHGRNVGAGDLTLTEAGTFTLNPPAGGTLVIPQGGTFTVKIVAADEADVFGVTVPL